MEKAKRKRPQKRPYYAVIENNRFVVSSKKSSGFCMFLCECYSKDKPEIEINDRTGKSYIYRRLKRHSRIFIYFDVCRNIPVNKKFKNFNEYEYSKKVSEENK